MQFTKENAPNILKFIGPENAYVKFTNRFDRKSADYTRQAVLVIKSFRGIIEAYEGDWVLKDENGNFFPFDSKAFVYSYEEVS